MVIPLNFVSNLICIGSDFCFHVNGHTIKFCSKISNGIGCANGSACPTCRPSSCDQRHMSGGAVAQVLERVRLPFNGLKCQMIPEYLKSFLGVLPGQTVYIHVFPTPGGDILQSGVDRVDCYVFCEKVSSYEFNYPKS